MMVHRWLPLGTGGSISQLFHITMYQPIQSIQHRWKFLTETDQTTQLRQDQKTDEGCLSFWVTAARDSEAQKTMKFPRVQRVDRLSISSCVTTPKYQPSRRFTPVEVSQRQQIDQTTRRLTTQGQFPETRPDDQTIGAQSVLRGQCGRRPSRVRVQGDQTRPSEVRDPSLRARQDPARSEPRGPDLRPSVVKGLRTRQDPAWSKARGPVKTQRGQSQRGEGQTRPSEVRVLRARQDPAWSKAQSV